MISATSSRRKSKRGCQRNPTRRRNGISATVCATMPSVVPNPSNWIWPVERVEPDDPRPPTATNSSRTAITTMLLMTGVHIGAAKCPRAFSTPPASELTP